LIAQLISMKVTAESKHTEEMLLEAMEMLDDMHVKMGMFERQRYGKLKTQFEQHTSLNKELREGLNEIEVC
jgi:hypothetical protein